MIDFPANPTVGQKYTTGGITWEWDGVKWTLAGNSPINIGDEPPPNPASGALWWDTVSANLFIWYDDGDTAQWVVAVNIGTAGAQGIQGIQGIQGETGPIGPQGVIGPQGPQGVIGPQGIQGPLGPVGPMGAVSIDALAYNGMQLNGSMDVNQEHAGGGAVTNGGYPVDCWSYTCSFGTTTMAQVADAPPGLVYSIKLTIQAAASMGPEDICYIRHDIEGYRVARLAWGTANAWPISVGFWTKIHRPGTYSGSIRSGDGADGSSYWAYPFTFIQHVADAWEYKTITIPGSPQGVWPRDNSDSVVLFICPASSQLLSPENAWINVNCVGAEGTINGMADTSDSFQITGVIILPGEQLPSALMAPLIMRPYDQEYISCMRYLQYNAYGESGFIVGNNSVIFWHKPKVWYRKKPIMSCVSSIYFEGAPWMMGISVTGAAVNDQHMTSVGGDYNLTGSFNQNNAAYVPASLLTMNAVKFDARF
jgi:hypothetical protein